MAVVENKRRSFKKAWRKMNDDQKDLFRASYLNAGYAISTFYNDKGGISNIPEVRVRLIEDIAKQITIKDIWD